MLFDLVQDKSDARKGAGVANVARQTWDREHYEKLAKLRAEGQLEKEEVRAACDTAAMQYSTTIHITRS